ncbi:hypothetical protein [Nitritalea halalkaliphila]|uniref:hypothetical protein n=1 Tax=Nitritalea halalkaliphila TaxID=590849 RepID=UPI0012EADE62|nr:hypothetical protein [Nitritalea halalkaliphila]
MREIEFEKQVTINGGGFLGTLLGGVACGAAIASVGLSAPLAYITCGLAFATTFDI